MLRLDIAPFLFRDNKQKNDPKTGKNINSSAQSLDSVAILTVESEGDFLFAHASQDFMQHTGGQARSILGFYASDISWINDHGSLQKQLKKSCRKKKPHYFNWKFTFGEEKKFLSCRVVPMINDDQNVSAFTLFLQDGPQDAEEAKQIEHFQNYDSLTNLPNKQYFQEIFEKECEGDSQFDMAVLFVNILQFQRINESYGYEFGDQVLYEFARKLCSGLPDHAILARFDNDKFAILLTSQDVSHIENDALTLAQSIHYNFDNDPLPLEREINISLCIGISSGRAGVNDLNNLLHNAHLAMQRAKDSKTLVYSSELRTRAESQLTLESDLRQALNHNQLEVYYQPIICLQTGNLLGLEALARWNHSERGMIPPPEFIALAEQTGLILPLGRWVMNEACQNLKEWIDQNPMAAALSVNVNVSNEQIAQDDIVGVTRDALSKSHLSGEHLKLEITESSLMENAVLARDILLDLKSLNVALAVDDFGTGYSSLNYLNRFPVDILKIDRSFVSHMGDNEESMKIVNIISNLATTLGLSVVAEGIETKEQLDILRELGCQFGQGFFISRPIPAKDVPEFIRQYSKNLVQGIE